MANQSREPENKVIRSRISEVVGIPVSRSLPTRCYSPIIGLELLGTGKALPLSIPILNMLLWH